MVKKVEAPPRIIISPPARFPVPNLKHLWESRDVVVRFGIRDITIRYRQTLLGIVWVILQPLLTALVFALVFGRVAKLPSNGVPYILFTYAGLIGWNLFSTVVTRGAGALVQNASLVSKVYFPRVHVPLSVALSAGLDYIVSFAFLIVLFAVNGFWPGWPIALLPVFTLLLLLLALGLGAVLSGLAVSYRDVQYVVPFTIQFLLYASPVAYAVSAVPARYRFWYQMNPLTWFMQEYRWCIVRQAMPPTWQIVGSIGVAISVFALCMVLFERMERGLADLI